MIGRASHRCQTNGAGNLSALEAEGRPPAPLTGPTESYFLAGPSGWLGFAAEKTAVGSLQLPSLAG